MSVLTDFLTNIANAIRSKDETQEPIPAENFADRILAIETGVDTTDATATAGDILSGKTAYANEQKVTGTIPSKAATTYTPKTTAQTIASGQYLRGAQTIQGSSNLTAANIKKGVNIFGVVGTVEEPIKWTLSIKNNLTGNYRFNILLVDITGKIHKTWNSSTYSGGTYSIIGLLWLYAFARPSNSTDYIYPVIDGTFNAEVLDEDGNTVADPYNGDSDSQNFIIPKVSGQKINLVLG